MHERLERLVKLEIAHIAQSLCEETRIEQVHTSVFRTAYVLIDGEHLVDYFGVKRHLVVMCVGVSEIIPARANECVHSIGVASCFAAALRAGGVHKFFAGSERGFSVGLELDVVRKFDGQVFFGYGYFSALVAVDDRNRCAPVSLT